MCLVLKLLIIIKLLVCLRMWPPFRMWLITLRREYPISQGLDRLKQRMVLGKINQLLLILLILFLKGELKLWNNICRNKARLLNKNYKLNNKWKNLGLRPHQVIKNKNYKCVSHTQTIKKRKYIKINNK